MKLLSVNLEFWPRQEDNGMAMVAVLGLLVAVLLLVSLTDPPSVKSGLR